MKKLTFMALALLASAAFNTAFAGKKKDVVQVATAAPVVLNTSSDSVSYAAGMAATRGLAAFIQQQYKVDTTYMADFVRGFRKALESNGDGAFTAYAAGMQIAQMAQQRILPSVQQELIGTKDSVAAKNFYNGFIAALEKDFTKYTEEEAQQLFEKRVEAAKKAKVEAAISVGKQWLADNAKKPGVVTLPSGLQYKVITNGTGDKPSATDEVVVKYEGKTTPSAPALLRRIAVRVSRVGGWTSTVSPDSKRDSRRFSKPLRSLGGRSEVRTTCLLAM